MTVRVLLAQLAPVPGDVDANVAAVAELVAAQRDADLAVFPELFLCGYDPPAASALAVAADDRAFAPIRRAAREAGVAVLVGFAERAPEGAVWNSVACIDASGAWAGAYRKTHLFGPVEAATFALGDDYLVVRLAGARVGPMICFDVEFPEPARAVAVAGAELLVTVAANMTPYADQHRLAARARALENRCPHVYVNRVGHEAGLAFVGGSCVVDAEGRVLAEAGPGDLDRAGAPGVLLVDLPVGGRPHDDFSYLEHLREPLPVRRIDPPGGPAAG